MISIWEKETFFEDQDIIIAGSGFVGLWCAYYLKKKAPQLKITILERDLIPAGASTRNAGFACFGSLTELIADEAKMGTDKMLQLVEMRYKGLLRIQKYFSPSQIDFDRCGGYELINQENNSLERLNSDLEYINGLLRQITGTKYTFKINDEKIAPFGFKNTNHLIKNSLEGYLHSGKLLQSLLQHVHSKGVQVFNGQEIIRYHNNDKLIEVETNNFIKLKAKKLLICTNAFAKALLPGMDILPARGQVLVTSPIQGLPFKGTFHSEEGYFYFRNYGNRVLLGGARHKAFKEEETTEINTSEFIQSELESYLEKVVLPNFKNQYKIEYRWSGIMAMGSEKMPIIEEVTPGIFCAIRMSGMGVALAPMAARTVSRMIVES